MLSAPVLWAISALAALVPQQERVVGIVIDPARHPLDAVQVIVNGREVRTVTGATGVFTLEVARTDSTVAFRRIGYQLTIYAIRPLPREGDTLIVRLQPSAIQLAELVVTGEASKPLRYAFTTKYDDVFRRRRIGLGTLVPRELIDARLGVRTEQLLDGIAGVHVWNGPPKRIRFTRCQDPGGIAIFINGVRQVASSNPHPTSKDASGLLYRPPSSGSSPTRVQDDEPEIDILARVNPSDIEMIEVFRGASEIPAEYHWNGCAVIAIWLREQ